MKRIRNRLYLGLVVIGLSAPLQVHAAGQDSVMLGQNGNQVAVSLEMSNAEEEKITTVAVSLELKTDHPDQIKVDFQFAPELSGTAHGCIYHEDTGRLDIYVASSKSLFGGDELNLGNVQVRPVDAKQSMLVDIGYCPNSFQTANGAYGNKTPVVGEVESVSIQIGDGTLTPPTPDSGSSGSGNMGTNSGSGGNNNGGSEGSNRDQGLYDETTRFTNDPANAQKIDSSIINRDKASTLLDDLSKGAAAVIAGKKETTANSIGQVKAKGKVSVLSPEKGPASIVVSKDNALGENQSGSLLSGTGGENSGGNDSSVWGENASLDNGSEEILLDRKNGGAVDNRKNDLKKRILLFGTASVGVVAVAGGSIFLLLKRRDWMLAGKAGKKKRKKRRPANKKKTANRKRTVNKKKAPNKKKVVNRKKPINRRKRPVRRSDWE